MIRERGIGCGLICGLLQAEAAGPDGIRRERPHLGYVLEHKTVFRFPPLYVAFPLYAGRLAGPHAASAVYVVNGVIGLAFMLSAKRWLVRINPATSTAYAYLAAAIAFCSVAAFDDLAWFLLFIAGYTAIETAMLPALDDDWFAGC